MANLLAIETSTDACSVAMMIDGTVTERHAVVPRQHSQRLFQMLRELLPDGRLQARGIDAVAYGCGPGSFTGLRVCASAVQGLCYANDLPAVAVSTLAGLASTALREGRVGEGDTVLSTLDAQIGEVYWSVCEIRQGQVVELEPDRVAVPGGCEVHTAASRIEAVGSGLRHLDAFPEGLRQRLGGRHGDLLPRARDLLPLASAAYDGGHVQGAESVRPVYVRDEISWKKLHEQGRRQ